MDDAKVELLGHHCCLCTQLPFGGAGGSLCARGTERRYRGRGDSGSPHHRAGGASVLPGCFGSCPTTFFARNVSRDSEKKASRRFVNRDNPPRTGLFTEVPR